jgi:hypothetical protein
MDSKNKQRSPQSTAIIGVLEKEFSTIVKDSPSTIMLNSKMSKFVQLIQDKTMTMCNNQIAELEKYSTTEERDGQTELRKIAGKEAEADRALANLQECQAPLANYMLALNMFSQYNLSLLSSSADLCLDDCDSKNIADAELKSCYRNCYENTYKFTLRSAENLLNMQIDAAVEEINKI